MTGALQARDFTLPERGSTTLHHVLAQTLKSTVRTFFSFPVARFPRRLAKDTLDVRTALSRRLRGDQAGMVFSLFRHPSVSTLVRCLDREVRGPGSTQKLDSLLTELNGTLSYGLARQRGEHGHPTPSRFPERLIVPGAQVTLRFTRPVAFTLGSRAVEVESHNKHTLISYEELEAGAGAPLGVEAQPAFEPIVPGVSLGLYDNNPLSDLEAHPDKNGNALSLGGRPLRQWTKNMKHAFELIRQTLPALGGDLQLALQTLIPVGYSSETHVSASYEEAIGVAYLSLHPSALTLAEALIHEGSHNKLNALLALDPLLTNGWAPLYSSPFRPDPRPLRGILLAAHAFLPVLEFLKRLRADAHPLSQGPEFEARLRRLRTQSEQAVKTLRTHANPTPLGAQLLEELTRISRAAQGRRTPPTPQVTNPPSG